MSTCPEVAHHWWNHHPPVGIFIGALALVSVIVPFVRDLGAMRRWEKASWTVLMFLLVFGEFGTLYADRAEHDSEQSLARCRELEQFQAIATTLNTQFGATMDGAQKVFNKTAQAADHATEALNQITGRDSWGWVLALPFSNLPNTMFFSVTNTDRKYPLRNVRLAILNLTTGLPRTLQQCDVGDIGPHTGYMAPQTASCIITINPAIENHYVITIGTYNRSTTEDLFFTPSANGPLQSYEVFKTYANGSKKVLLSFGRQKK
jgi:hypothetical protein